MAKQSLKLLMDFKKSYCKIKCGINTCKNCPTCVISKLTLATAGKMKIRDMVIMPKAKPKTHRADKHDVIALIRCANCEYFDSFMDHGYCQHPDMVCMRVDRNWYCGHAERRED